MEEEAGIVVEWPALHQAGGRTLAELEAVRAATGSRPKGGTSEPADRSESRPRRGRPSGPAEQAL